MSTNPLLKKAKEFAEQHDWDRIMIIGIRDDKKTHRVSWANTKEKCQQTKIMVDFIWIKFCELFSVANLDEKMHMSTDPEDFDDDLNRVD